MKQKHNNNNSTQELVYLPIKEYLRTSYFLKYCEAIYLCSHVLGKYEILCILNCNHLPSLNSMIFFNTIFLPLSLLNDMNIFTPFSSFIFRIAFNFQSFYHKKSVDNLDMLRIFCIRKSKNKSKKKRRKSYAKNVKEVLNYQGISWYSKA